MSWCHYVVWFCHGSESKGLLLRQLNVDWLILNERKRRQRQRQTEVQRALMVGGCQSKPTWRTLMQLLNGGSSLPNMVWEVLIHPHIYNPSTAHPLKCRTGFAAEASMIVAWEFSITRSNAVGSSQICNSTKLQLTSTIILFYYLHTIDTWKCTLTCSYDSYMF